MKQYEEEMLWQMIENFYQSLHLFQKEYFRFEKKVTMYCDEKKIKRADLAVSLNIDEAISLINYEKLKDLKTNFLQPLRKVSQQFTDSNLNNNVFNHYVSDLYYELSILQDEVFKLKINAHECTQLEEEEYQNILNEVHIFFLKMFHLWHLFRKAKSELEKIIGHYRKSKILIRSFFLFGEELLTPLYENGISEFAKIIYPGDHLLELYARSAISFYDSGFSELALQAAQKAQHVVNYVTTQQFSDVWLAKLQNIIKTCSAESQPSHI